MAIVVKLDLNIKIIRPGDATSLPGGRPEASGLFSDQKWKCVTTCKTYFQGHFGPLGGHAVRRPGRFWASGRRPWAGTNKQSDQVL